MESVWYGPGCLVGAQPVSLFFFLDLTDKQTEEAQRVKEWTQPTSSNIKSQAHSPCAGSRFLEGNERKGLGGENPTRPWPRVTQYHTGWA